jgi:glutamyl-tRNA synthetase
MVSSRKTSTSALNIQCCEKSIQIHLPEVELNFSTMGHLAMASKVRTRFAPSPTGFLHLGGARTALYSWAYARHFGGEFVLRIEDTDLERSKPEAVQAIIDGMHWLGLNHDEGPYYQMQRMDRYREVIESMLADGTAYHCYCSIEELETMRSQMRADGGKPRYDGTWRPEPGKALPAIPTGVKPVVRFKNPLDGDVTWRDVVKGTITIANKELDDLVIAREDGTPTYNFCVAVDDSDMKITHVLRGDDHVNNTPRQINILRAIGAEVPQYGHLPMILGPDGEKMSKRHGAVSVMEYPAQGYLPEAMLNYLARLGWSHGDDEIFSLDQFVGWFDLTSLTPSSARFDDDKLGWLNNHYIRQADLSRLADLVAPLIESKGASVQDGPALTSVLALMRDRAKTLVELADLSLMFYRSAQPDKGDLERLVTSEVREALRDFLGRCAGIEWTKPAIAATLKDVLSTHGMKMPQLAMPLRLIVAGQQQTPGVDAVLEVFGRECSTARIERAV